MLGVAPITSILWQVWPLAVKAKACYPLSGMVRMHAHAWRVRLES